MLGSILLVSIQIKASKVHLGKEILSPAKKLKLNVVEVEREYPPHFAGGGYWFSRRVSQALQYSVVVL